MAGKILVVDDDPDILDAVTMILESQGYQVFSARDGLEGLATLKAENPDLMILDLMMPKMDGFAVCKELQDPRWSKYRDIPILMLTSVREEASRRRYELNLLPDHAECLGISPRAGTFARIAKEFDVTVQVQDVGATGNVIVPFHPRRDRIVVDINVALCRGAGGWVVDVGDEKPLDAFSQAIERSGADSYISVNRRRITVPNISCWNTKHDLYECG